MTKQLERPEFADEVQLVLERALPGSIERAELVDQTGLDTNQVRESIDYFESTGELTETRGGDLQWGEGGGDDDADSAAAALMGSGGDDEEEPDDEGEPGPALDAHVRARMEVVCTFGRGPRDTDASAVKKAGQIAIEIGNALAVALPKLDFHVEVRGVDAYDKPRALYPAPPPPDE